MQQEITANIEYEELEFSSNISEEENEIISSLTEVFQFKKELRLSYAEVTDDEEIQHTYSYVAIAPFESTEEQSVWKIYRTELNKNGTIKETKVARNVKYTDKETATYNPI